MAKARQQYFADEVTLQKESRDFSITPEIIEKLDSIETWAQVNVIETVKVNWEALTPDEDKAVDISVPLVDDTLYSTSSEDALSARQWRILYDYIQNIQSRWRFLSNWNCVTWLAMTNPADNPYLYRTWDYYLVSNVASQWWTNYRPDWSQYVIAQASTTVETDTVKVWDMYIYDWTSWLLLVNTEREIAIDSSLSTSSTNPVENRVITNALNWKQDTLIAWTNIQIAADWKTISATDTTYSSLPAAEGGVDVSLVTTGEKFTWNGKQDKLVAWSNISIAADWKTISAVDTTYASLPAAQGWTDVSLVTTWEKYTWNNKQDTIIGWTNVTIWVDWKTINAIDTTYTAWTNISIDANNEISAVDTTYSAGTNISIDANNEISAVDTTYPNLPAASGWTDDSLVTTWEKYTWDNKQDELIAWTNIQIASDWKTISATDTTYVAGDFDIKDLADTTWLRTTWSWKQDALTAGTNIQIDSNTNTISATDTTYTAWANVSISNNNVISATDNKAVWWNITWTLADQTDLNTALWWKQDVLTAWDNVTIENVCSNDMQWPAPEWFHVPLTTEWQAVYNIWTTLGWWSSDGDSIWANLKLPFAGNRDNVNANVYSQGEYGLYWCSTPYNNDSAYLFVHCSFDIYPQYSSERSYGYSVRCFKDTPVIPTSSWAKLYWTSIEAGGIFWSSDLWLISLSSNWTTWITIADKNLWATTVWNSWNTLSEANCGKYFQRWNNYWFPRTWTITDTSSTQVDASIYWPWNYYNSSTFITWNNDWSSVQNDNLWWWVSQWQSCALIISSHDTTYTAGTWIDITNWVISNTQTSAEWWNITWTLSDQTDLKNALDWKVNLWNNQIFDSTVVEIWKWVDSWWTQTSWHHVTLDPNGELSTYNITASWYNEATLSSGKVELLHNTALGGDETLTLDHEKLVVNDWTNSKTYNFYGNDRVATLSDVSSATSWAVSDTAYAASWDWVTTVAPSKNAVYDKLNAMDTTIAWKQDALIAWTNITIAADGKTISATDTTYTAWTNVQINNWVISATDTTYNTATSSTAWLVKLWSSTTQTESAQSPSSTAWRTYPVQLNSSDQMVVNVPWEDTQTWSATSTAAGTVKLFSDTTQTETAQSVSSTANRTYWIQNNSSNQMVVNVPWIDTTYGAWTYLTINWTTFDVDTTLIATKSDLANFAGFQVVATLPTSDIKTNIIYLLWPFTSTTGSDKYEEWIYSNSNWIMIWETSVDLSPYFNYTTQTSDAITQWSTNLFLTSAERTLLWNTSWTNSGDETKTTIQTKLWAATASNSWYLTSTDWSTFNWKADKTEVLTKTNTTAFTPTWDYQPATKKYVDDNKTELHAWEWISIEDVLINWRKWPSPDGFHVPSTTEWQWLKTIMDWLSLTTWTKWKTNLHMPFAGCRDYSSASLNIQGSVGFYWSSSPYGSSYPNNARYLSLDSSSVGTDDLSGRAYGFSVRCFKDSYVVPDSTWTVVQWTLWSAWIFRNQTDGLISITSDWTTGYTIMDKNLWATTVYNNWDTLSQANMWNMYQWWNNYWFPSTWTITNTSSTQVDASSYWPTNPYSSDTFIIWSQDWSSVRNSDLWWDTSWTITQKNVISNTGVLSVNWQTGDVTVNVPTDYVTLTTNQTITGSKIFDWVNTYIQNWDLEVIDAESAWWAFLVTNRAVYSAEKITHNNGWDFQFSWWGNNQIARLSDVNTKTFRLASTSDDDNILAIGRYSYAWGNPIIIFWNQTYVKDSVLSSVTTYRCSEVDMTPDNNTGLTVVSQKLLNITYERTWWQFPAEMYGCTTGTDTIGNVLQSGQNYTTSYTPEYNGSPATKKYVDDTAAGKISDTAYAASWDWVTTIAPSKNAVYDKISAMDTTIASKANDSDVVKLTWTQTITWTKAFSWVDVNINNWNLEVFDSDPGQLWLISDWITISADKITAHDNSDIEYTFTWSWSTKIARLWDLSWYIPYSDFNWQTKTWATFTLDLASTITPSANFTVNAPATLKDWQTYILRVNNGATAYTMTLWTGITNPFGTSLTLTANGVDQFVFLAIGWDLELQPEIEWWSGWVTSVNGQTWAVTVQETLTSGTNIKTINSTSLLWSGNIAVQASLSNITAAEIKTWTATTQRSVTAAALAGWLVRISDQANNILANWWKLWAWTQANYEALSSYDSNTVYLTV